MCINYLITQCIKKNLLFVVVTSCPIKFSRMTKYFNTLIMHTCHECCLILDGCDVRNQYLWIYKEKSLVLCVCVFDFYHIVAWSFTEKNTATEICRLLWLESMLDFVGFLPTEKSPSHVEEISNASNAHWSTYIGHDFLVRLLCKFLSILYS